MLIVIVSGRGGVGKTALTSSLARAFSAKAKTVIAIDGCCRARDLDLQLGVQDKVVYDWSDVLYDECALTDALIPVCEKLSLLSSPQLSAWQEAYTVPFTSLMERLQKQADIILLDCPCYTMPEAAFFAALADTLLMLSTADDSSIRKAEAALNILCCNKDRYLIAVQPSSGSYPSETVSQLLDIPLLGVWEGDAAGCANVLANKLLGEEVSEKKSFLHLFSGRRKRF